jgi:hypothetical protein
MVRAYVEALSAFLGNLAGMLPPGLWLSFATAFIQGGEYLSSFRHEFVGTLLMVGFTFSAGKWIGSESMRMGWMSHFLGEFGRFLSVTSSLDGLKFFLSLILSHTPLALFLFSSATKQESLPQIS